MKKEKKMGYKKIRQTLMALISQMDERILLEFGIGGIPPWEVCTVKFGCFCSGSTKLQMFFLLL